MSREYHLLIPPARGLIPFYFVPPFSPFPFFCLGRAVSPFETYSFRPDGAPPAMRNLQRPKGAGFFRHAPSTPRYPAVRRRFRQSSQDCPCRRIAVLSSHCGSVVRRRYPVPSTPSVQTVVAFDLPRQRPPDSPARRRKPEMNAPGTGTRSACANLQKYTRKGPSRLRPGFRPSAQQVKLHQSFTH